MEAFVILSATTRVTARRLAELDREEAARIADGDSDALSTGKDARARDILLSMHLVHATLFQELFDKVRLPQACSEISFYRLKSISDSQGTWCYRGSRGSGRGSVRPGSVGAPPPLTCPHDADDGALWACAHKR